MVTIVPSFAVPRYSCRLLGFTWPPPNGDRGLAEGGTAGRGDTIVYEEHILSTRAAATGTIDRIPAACSSQRKGLRCSQC